MILSGQNVGVQSYTGSGKVCCVLLDITSAAGLARCTKKVHLHSKGVYSELYTILPQLLTLLTSCRPSHTSCLCCTQPCSVLRQSGRTLAAAGLRATIGSIWDACRSAQTSLLTSAPTICTAIRRMPVRCMNALFVTMQAAFQMPQLRNNKEFAP